MIKMLVSLRSSEDSYASAFHFALPLRRIWFENVENDLHLQFTGHEDINICPPDNSLDDEMIVPLDSVVFRDWLDSVGLTSVGTLRFQSCLIESVDPENASLPEPTPEALADLVRHWDSPNRAPRYHTPR